jgi:hypothetical protein
MSNPMSFKDVTKPQEEIGKINVPEVIHLNVFSVGQN